MYGKILVPVDGSETSACGLDEAIKIAGELGSRIRLVHIMNELVFGGGGGIYASDLIVSLRNGGQSLLAQAAARVRQQGVDADTVMVESMGASAADFIVDHARLWSADLIVMGGVPRWPGRGDRGCGLRGMELSGGMEDDGR